MRKNGKEGASGAAAPPPFGVGKGWAPYFERKAKRPKRARRRASPPAGIAAGAPERDVPRFLFWCPGCDRPAYEAACRGCGRADGRRVPRKPLPQFSFWCRGCENDVDAVYRRRPERDGMTGRVYNSRRMVLECGRCGCVFAETKRPAKDDG